MCIRRGCYSGPVSAPFCLLETIPFHSRVLLTARTAVRLIADTDRGTETCAGRPGAKDHEALDAATYASWGVDYLKEDSCHASGDHKTAYADYGKMRDGLNKTGRPILFSLCGWNAWYSGPDPSMGYGGGKTLGNSFRIGPDDTNWHGVLTNIDINADLAAFAGPGAWNDPCLLLAETYKGDQRITETQSRSQFSMWLDPRGPCSCCCISSRF